MGDIFDQVAAQQNPSSADSTNQSPALSVSGPGPVIPPQAGVAPLMSPEAEPTSRAAQAAPKGDIFDQVAAQHDGSFQTPSGQTLAPGTLVHVNGHTGTVMGLHPESHKVVINWGSKPRWNPFAAPVEDTSEVAPNDIDATPNALTSAVAGTGTSLVKTAQGAAKIVHAPKSVQSTLESDQQQLTQAKNANPFAGGAGSLAGDVLQFLAGGEALKAGTEAVSLSDLMQQSGKIAKAIEKFPRLAKALQVGLRAGTVQGTIGTVNSGGDLGQGLKEGLATGAAGGTLSLAGDAIPSIYRKLYPAEIPQTVEDPQPVYDALHQGLRDTIDRVAQDAGVVDVKPSASIRDVVKNTANAVRAKASSLYQQMDNALLSMSDTGEDLPGRFQKFDEDISKLTDKIADAIGEPEKQQQYAEALDQVKANKEIALQKIKDAGLPPDLPEQAARIHKQSRALEDLSKATQSSTTGLRPGIRNLVLADAEEPSAANRWGAEADEKPKFRGDKLAAYVDKNGFITRLAGQPPRTTTPERINPIQFSRNLNKLYDNTRFGGRRLVQAVGTGAEDLLAHADSAKNALERISERAEVQAEQAARIAAQRARARAVAGTAAATAGLGELLHKGSSVADAVRGALGQ